MNKPNTKSNKQPKEKKSNPYDILQGQRLSDVLDFIKSAHYKTQNEVVKEFNKNKGLEIAVEYFSRYKKGILTIPTELIDFLQEKYAINPEYIRGNSKFKLNITNEMLYHFEKIAINWMTSYEKSEFGIAPERILHLEMDGDFYQFLVTNSLIKLLEKEFKEVKVNTTVDKTNGAKTNVTVDGTNGTTNNKNTKTERFVLIPENKWIELIEMLKFNQPNNTQNHFKELKKYILTKIEDSDKTVR